MTQLEKLKSLIPQNELKSDAIMQFYLDCGSDIICELRDSDIVEIEYLNVQIQIAIELFNKRGAEGELSHSENGISRMYEKSDISPSLLSKIHPMARTPFSTKRVIV